MTEQQELELDSWMARAYEAEGKLWKAEARIKAVEDVLDNLEQQSPDQIGWDAAGLLPVLRRALESVPPTRRMTTLPPGTVTNGP